LAEEIAQSVFVDLACKAHSVAGRLAEDASLIGWLYRGTRFAALTARREKHRRQSRERQAMEQLDPPPDTPADWDRLRPVLDEAMERLSEADRDAFCSASSIAWINAPTESGRRPAVAMNACLLSFFDKYLKSQEEGLVDDPARVYPEVIGFSKK
jgi:hypothetical protein